MTPPRCRLLPYAVAAGPDNMAADEVLLESAAAGTASLRCYGWSEPTVSLGYFQPQQVRSREPNLDGLPFVRRPSGGATLVHDRELTYALALPAGPPWQTGEPWLIRMHRILAAALAGLGVTVVPHAPVGEGPPFAGVLCFQHFTAGDLLLGAAKVGGSAQRKQRGALLQHGAVLLAASPHAPALPGICELTGVRLTTEQTAAAVARQFAQATGWELVPGGWTDAEWRRKDDLAAAKYHSDNWNRKR